MVGLTGDTHGKFERIKTYCDNHHTKKEDLLIILGDAGINYMGYTPDKMLKDKLKTLPITLLCVHGNHEMRPNSLGYYVEKEWWGGIVYVEPEYPNILFAKDGEIYNIDNKSVMPIGGAYSVDKYYRIMYGYRWFSDEQPDEHIKEYVESQLEKANWKIDVILSHTVPEKYLPTECFVPGLDQSMVDCSTEEWLDKIEDRLTYEKWYAGHFHCEKIIDRLQIMFEDYTML